MKQRKCSGGALLPSLTGRTTALESRRPGQGAAIVWWLAFVLCLALVPGYASATGRNLAPSATITVSSAIDDDHNGSRLSDGVIRVAGKGCWVSKGTETFWGEIDLPWVKMEWNHEVCVDKVVLYDLPSLKSNIASGVLRFSDGSAERVLGIPANGAPVWWRSPRAAPGGCASRPPMERAAGSDCPRWRCMRHPRPAPTL